MTCKCGIPDVAHEDGCAAIVMRRIAVESAASYYENKMKPIQRLRLVIIGVSIVVGFLAGVLTMRLVG